MATSITPGRRAARSGLRGTRSAPDRRLIGARSARQALPGRDLGGGGGERELEEGEGIDEAAGDANGDVEVGTGGAASVTGEADLGAAGDLVAFGDGGL